MVLLTAYNRLKKQEPDGTYRGFTPLRAVGLGLELAWKLCRDRGFGSATPADIRQIRVSGPLRIQTERLWRAVPAW